MDAASGRSCKDGLCQDGSMSDFRKRVQSGSDSEPGILVDIGASAAYNRKNDTRLTDTGQKNRS